MHRVCFVQPRQNTRLLAQLVECLIHVTLPLQNTTVQIQPSNGLWFSRPTQGTASHTTKPANKMTRGIEPKAFDWMRLLCGVRIGQSQRTLPRTPARHTHPNTRRCVHVDVKKHVPERDTDRTRHFAFCW